MRINFNITMMDLKCDYASVDVVSVLGTEQNITTHVNKWHVDADGVRQRYQGRNKAQKDIELFDPTVGQTLEELHEGGIDAVSLTPETLEYARREFEYVFVDFYASWYVWIAIEVLKLLVVVLVAMVASEGICTYSHANSFHICVGALTAGI